MQQTEADGGWSWFQTKKASPDRPENSAHLWVAPKKSETITPVQEIHELKQRYNAEVFSLQTKIISLNEAISIKDREIKRQNDDNSELKNEMRQFRDIEKLVWAQQEEIQSLKKQLEDIQSLKKQIQSLKKQLPHEVVWDEENDIASA